MQSKTPPTLSHFVPSQNTEVTLVFAFSEIVAPKSIVAKLKWTPELAHNDSKLDLIWSKSLDSYFAYLPGATYPTLKDGPKLVLDGPGRLEISYVNWPSRTPISEGSITGTYVRTKRLFHGQLFSGLQRIHEVGVTH